MAKLFKTLIILVVLAAVAAGVYAFARSNKNDDGNKLVAVETGSITEKAIAVGQIQPRQKFSVKSKMSGIVRAVRVEIGDTVAVGDSLFEIVPDPTPQELTEVDRSLDSARASFERARAEYGRAQELSRSGVLPKADLEGKREAFEEAHVLLEARSSTRSATGSSPWRGRISSTSRPWSPTRSGTREIASRSSSSSSPPTFGSTTSWTTSRS